MNLAGEPRSVRLRGIVRLVGGGTPEASEGNWGGDIPFVTPPDLRLVHGAVCASTERSVTFRGAENGSRIVPAGAVLVSKRAPIGYVSRLAMDAAFNQGCLALVPLPGAVNGRFLTWALSVRAEEMQVLGRGTTFTEISSGDLANLLVFLPGLRSQSMIADYLDHETAQIDAMIGKQQRLIETLQERRRAIVERLVSRGLAADVPLKPSQLRWAGEVPEHWRVGNIRRFAVMKTGHTPSRSVDAYWVNCDIPWLTLADVGQMRADRELYASPDTTSRISALGLANSAAELLPRGTVMLSRTASVGFSAIMPTAMATSQDYWNWVCGPDLLPEYLVLVFRAMRQEFRALMLGSTHKTIYEATAASLAIPVPPLPEQQVIVDRIAQETGAVDALIAKAQQLIALSRERRSALITAAVTGQIDVRTAS